MFCCPQFSFIARRKFKSEKVWGIVTTVYINQVVPVKEPGVNWNGKVKAACIYVICAIWYFILYLCFVSFGPLFLYYSIKYLRVFEVRNLTCEMWCMCEYCFLQGIQCFGTIRSNKVWSILACSCFHYFEILEEMKLFPRMKCFTLLRLPITWSDGENRELDSYEAHIIYFHY